ncbi:hypothetical protein BGZ46_002296 [Entomortierella lignicola]|nr:hypothetical protein BGZ46_002296 [Entomortierella lignicola]
MGISLFDMPELAILISWYLNPCDIARMMATCKNLAHVLEPMLWRNLTIQRCQPERDILLRNRRCIQTLQVLHVPAAVERHLFNTLLEPPITIDIQKCDMIPSTESGLSYVAGPSFVLENLNFVNIKNASYPENVLLLISHCPRLTHLEITYKGFILYSLSTIPQVLDSFANNVQQLVYLRHLRLEGYVLRQIISLLHACLLHPNLHELDLISSSVISDEVIDNHEGFELILKSLEDAKRTTGFSSNICSLEIPPLHGGYPATFITTLVRDHLPNLERFTFPGVRFDPPVDPEEAYRGACSKLQHLSLTSEQYKSMTDRFIAECSKDLGLKSFRTGNIYRTRNIMNHEIVLNTLLQYHSATLEQIEITGYTFIESPVLQSILMNCRSLKRFWVQCSSDLASAVDIKDIISGEWVCLGLKELRLTLTWAGGNNIYHKEAKVPRELAQKVYTQIGRLVKLEKLNIGYANHWPMAKFFESDLTLSQGWLSEFVGFSELREFSMTTHFWKKIGQAEVEFMNTNWPKLETIACSGDAFWCEVTYSDIQEMSHWRWLKNQRPWLVIKAAYRI